MDKESVFNREKLGLQDRGLQEICCKDCKTVLMVFQITKTNADLVKNHDRPMYTKVLVRCDHCGGSSDKKVVAGQFYPGAASNSTHFEPLEDKVEGCDIVFRAW